MFSLQSDRYRDEWSTRADTRGACRLIGGRMQLLQQLANWCLAGTRANVWTRLLKWKSNQQISIKLADQRRPVIVSDSFSARKTEAVLVDRRNKLITVNLTNAKELSRPETEIHRYHGRLQVCARPSQNQSLKIVDYRLLYAWNSCSDDEAFYLKSGWMQAALRSKSANHIAKKKCTSESVHSIHRRPTRHSSICHLTGCVFTYL